MQEKYFHEYFAVQKDVVVLLPFLGTQLMEAAPGARQGGTGSKAPAFRQSAAVEKREDCPALHFCSLCETRGDADQNTFSAVTSTVNST